MAMEKNNSNSSLDAAMVDEADDTVSLNPAKNNWGVDEVAGSDAVLTLYGLICAVGLAGNLLVCTVLLRVKSFRSNTSDFLVHLSLVDLLVCILVVPFKILPPFYPIRLQDPLPGLWGQLRCRVYVSQYPFWLCAITSVFNLVLVSYERYSAIVHPHTYKRIFSRRNRLAMLASCWVLAAVTKSFTLFVYDEDQTLGCRFLGWPSRGFQTVLGIYNSTLNLFAPFAIMIALQSKVIATLRRQMQALSGDNASGGLNPSDQRKMWQLRATQTLVRTLVVFAITFAICWAPNQLMFLLYNLGVRLSFASPIYHIGVILAVGNSCVNPIIYTVTNQAFRRGIREVLRCERGSARVGDASTASSRVMDLTSRSTAK